jgi:hypothetical protein
VRMTIRVVVMAMAFAFACALSVTTFAAAAEPRDPVPGRDARDARDASAPNTSQRRPPATPPRRAGSVTKARGLQHPVQSNGEALRSTLRTPAHRGGLQRSPMTGKAIAHPHSIVGGNAPNSAQVRPLNTGSVSAMGASGHVSSTQPIAPSAMAASGRVSGTRPIGPSAITAGRGVIGPQSVPSNGVPGNRRPPTGLVAIGGAVTNHNATRGVLDGNSVHRRF